MSWSAQKDGMHLIAGPMPDVLRDFLEMVSERAGMSLEEWVVSMLILDCEIELDSVSDSDHSLHGMTEEEFETWRARFAPISRLYSKSQPQEGEKTNVG